MVTCIFHLQNLTALHVGTGQGVGIVDLPIARSKATNLPIVPGSAIKGVFRDELKSQDIIQDSDVNTLFGKSENADHAGAVAFGDANLLILPIRSFAGTVAFATCPYILRQYGRDIKENLVFPTIEENKAYVVESSALLLGDKIALEDLGISAETVQEIKDIADKITQALYPDSTPNADEWRKQFNQRFVILPDNIFSFLVDTATEIRTRICIERETKMVKEGALWTEENLPAEAVLWGVLGISQSRDNKNKKDAKELANLLPKDEVNIQIGGKHTIGRGFCRLLITNKNKGES